MEHTELPWEIMWQGSDSFAVGIRDRQLVVAEVIDSHVESETAKANAEYIVRACNALPVMLEAINDLIEANQHARDLSLNRDEPHRGMIWGEARSMLDVAKLKAKAALAAGGE